jgi:serine/threonine protein kinase
MAIYEDILGSLVGERYRITERLGAGAFGEVFNAQHECFGLPLRTVALKLFTKAHVTNDNAQKVFQEALILEALASQARSRGETVHLVVVHDIGVLKDYKYTPYIAMEYVDGGSLGDQLHRAGCFPLQTVVRHVLDICAGLRLAHEASPSIIHRDLKPENVLVTQSGFVKVADFGLAIDRYEAFRQAGGAGTMSYSPPESREAVPSSPAYDIYSLGVMMLEMLIGKNPLEVVLHRARETGKRVELLLQQAQELLAELRNPDTGQSYVDTCTELRDCPPFQDVLMKCLALGPTARFSGAYALDTALRTCLGDSSEALEESFENAEEQVERLLRQAYQCLHWDDVDKAHDLFEQVQRLNDREPRAFFGLSEVYEKQHKIGDAIREQKIGTGLSRSTVSMERLAHLYNRVGRRAEANAALLIAKSLANREKP